jgi:peptide deformylase
VDVGAEAELVARVTQDLLDTMAEQPGCVGIAAPQIGEEVRMAVVDCTGHRKVPLSNGLLVLVNPLVISASQETEIGREGCLSIPELTANVRRSCAVVVEAADGVRVSSEGFEARCLFHELDHLDGLLFLDRVESLSRDVFQRKQRTP